MDFLRMGTIMEIDLTSTDLEMSQLCAWAICLSVNDFFLIQSLNFFYLFNINNMHRVDANCGTHEMKKKLDISRHSIFHSSLFACLPACFWCWNLFLIYARVVHHIVLTLYATPGFLNLNANWWVFLPFHFVHECVASFRPMFSALSLLLFRKGLTISKNWPVGCNMVRIGWNFWEKKLIINFVSVQNAHQVLFRKYVTLKDVKTI